MCGIIGIIGNKQVSPLILECLSRLEYRGYDSAGIATLVDGNIERRRTEGKLHNLEASLQKEALEGVIGIGHTRWATHGMPTKENAHPHASEDVAVVHNGIIENFIALREDLQKEGAIFQSETDTEVIVHLLSRYIAQGKTPREAVKETLSQLHGAFALAILFKGHEDLLIGARKGSPLAIGHGDGETYLGSDALALAPLTSKITYLEEGDWVEIKADEVTIFDVKNRQVTRKVHQTNLSGALIGKGNFRHFMHKEIYDQPVVIGETLQAYINPTTRQVQLPGLDIDFKNCSRITIVACGTSYYAAMTGKYWIEQLAGIPVEVDIASEYRYRGSPAKSGDVAIFISQSGETADTLAALRYAKEQGMKTIGVVNVPQSSIVREVDVSLLTYAGPEIGVASTKAFSCQVTLLSLLFLHIARNAGKLSEEQEKEHLKELLEVPSHITEVLKQEENLVTLSHNLVKTRDVLFLGRGTSYPVALEGALKLKEISYIHAEGYAAGEMKHGPIALIDENTPSIVIAPSDNLFEKTLSNLQEIVARGGPVIVLSDEEGQVPLQKLTGIKSIFLPKTSAFVTPLLFVVPLQLLAYHTAVLKGTDVDQPRNLAKSVTVE